MHRQEREVPAWKQYIYRLVVDHKFLQASFWIALTLNVAIVTSSLTYVYSSLPEYRVTHSQDPTALVPYAIAVHDFVCALLFSVEAVLRLTCAPSLRALVCKTTFVMDLLALVPWYAKTLGGVEVEVLSAARMLRTVRVLLMCGSIKKLLFLISTTFRRAANMLMLLACLTTMMICMLGFLLWPAERGDWDDHRRMFVRNSGWRCPTICERLTHFGLFAGCAGAGDEVWISASYKVGLEQHRCVQVQVSDAHCLSIT